MFKNHLFAMSLLTSFVLSSTLHAATFVAASSAHDDVQNAVNAAGNGDTVQIPAGMATWTSAVSWTNKNVTVLGAGKDNTVITCQECFKITSNVNTSQYSHWRLTGMTLKGAAPGGMTIAIWDNNSSMHSGWRIDNMKFNFPGPGSGYGIFNGGGSYGLIDHNEFIWGGGLAIINVGMMNSTLGEEWPGSINTLQGGYIESQPLDMGTEKALYIEDNTFTGSSPGGMAAYDVSSGGARAVFRYNTVIGGIYYSHWTRNLEIGGILHEVYNNKFIGNSNYNWAPIRLEAGTGVIFNNTITGYTENYALVDERRSFMESSGALGACDGTKSWDGNAGDPAAPGWPCLGQIGRAPGKTMAQITGGDKQVSCPLYLWNNGAQDGCRSGGTCTNSLGLEVYDGSAKAKAYIKATPHPNGEVDYVLNGSTPKPGYTPYIYPHPLQGAGGSSIKPTRLRQASGMKPLSYAVYNIKGQKVSTMTDMEIHNAIQAKLLTTGLYLTVAGEGREQIIKKIAVMR
jgi:hypothetical protein